MKIKTAGVAALLAAAVLAAGAMMPATPGGTETKTVEQRLSALETTTARHTGELAESSSRHTYLDGRVTANAGTITGMQSIQTRNRAIINALPGVVPKWAMAELAKRDAEWGDTQLQLHVFCDAEDRAHPKKTFSQVSSNFDLTGWPSSAPDDWEWGGLVQHDGPRNLSDRQQVVGCFWSARWDAPHNVRAYLSMCARAGDIVYRVEPFTVPWADRHDDFYSNCPRRDADASYQLTTPELPTPTTTTSG